MFLFILPAGSLHSCWLVASGSCTFLGFDLLWVCNDLLGFFQGGVVLYNRCIVPFVLVVVLNFCILCLFVLMVSNHESFLEQVPGPHRIKPLIP